MVEHMSQNQKFLGLKQTINFSVELNLASVLIYLEKQWLYVPNAKLSFVSQQALNVSREGLNFKVITH